MALGDGLDIDKMMRGGYGSRADLPSVTEVPPAPAPYVAPADLGGFVDELSQGGPAPRPADQPTRTATTPAPRPTVRTKMAADIAAEIGLDMSKPPSTPQEAAQQAEILRADEAAFRMGAPSAVDAAAGLSQQGGQVFDEAFARAGETVTTPGRKNPMRPIVESGAREALGGYVLDPATGKAMLDENGEPIFEQGYVEEQGAALAQEGAAQIDSDRQIADLVKAHAAAEYGYLAIDQEIERLRAQRLDQAVAAVEQARTHVSQTAQKLAQQPGTDHNRLWANMGAGRKAAFIITAIIGGVGGVDTTDLMAKAIDDDVADQESAYSRVADQFSAAQTEFDAARQAYADAVLLTNDKRAASEMMKESRWLAQAKTLEAKAAEMGVPITEARIAAKLAEFHERANESRMRWQQIVAATPPTVGGGTRSKWNPLQQKMLAKKAEAGIEGQQKFAGQAIDIAGEQETERIKAAGKAGEDQQKMLRGEGGVYREAQQFANNYGPFLDVVNQIDQLDKNFGDDYPGVGPFAGTETITQWDRHGEFEAAVGQLREAIGRARSQGAITEEEETRFLDSIDAGTFVGGETRYRANLNAIKRAFQSRVDPGVRALSPEGREYINRNGMLAEPDPMSYGLAPQAEVVRQK